MATPSPSQTPTASETRTLLAAARAGDPCAETALFKAFYTTLRHRATHRLYSLGPLADPSHIAASAIKSLLVKLAPGHEPHEYADEITEVGQVWAFLFTASERRIVDAHRAAGRQKRGARQTMSASDLPAGVDAADAALGPEAAVEMADLVERALARLEPRERQVTELKLLGYRTAEITEALDLGKRLVEAAWTSARRKLAAFGDEVRIGESEHPGA
jgi:DNA-directed RNA polymerase specialized sigma24 family protein